MELFTAQRKLVAMEGVLSRFETGDVIFVAHHDDTGHKALTSDRTANTVDPFTHVCLVAWIAGELFLFTPRALHRLGALEGLSHQAGTYGPVQAVDYVQSRDRFLCKRHSGMMALERARLLPWFFQSIPDACFIRRVSGRPGSTMPAYNENFGGSSGLSQDKTGLKAVMAAYASVGLSLPQDTASIADLARSPELRTVTGWPQSQSPEHAATGFVSMDFRQAI